MDAISNDKLDVDQKFARALVKLRSIRPFYSAVFETIPHIESKSIETMGVTVNKLKYNYDFCDKLQFEEFMFVVLHEIGHIALMHVARCEHRDPILWNLACDLYVNKMLAEEFDLKPGVYNSHERNLSIKMPEFCLYCSSLDLDVDFVERIYECFAGQAKQNGYFDKGAYETDDKEDNDKKYEFTYTGSSKDTEEDSFCSCDDEERKKYETFKITISKAKKFTLCDDLIDDGSDSVQKDNDAKRILSEAKMRYDMTAKNAGYGAGRLLFEVEALLKSRVDWKKLLRKYCINFRMKDTSFNTPDKRMYYQNAIYPGQTSENQSVLKDVKVCIDTSGSMSDEDLAYIMGQVLDLTKQFKTFADIIAWDAEVESVQSLNGTAQVHTKLKGRGGTDAGCVFQYFDSKECKVKPFVTLVFTDGYFDVDEFNPKWKRKYANTVWVMTRNYNADFKPPFGKLAFAKFSSPDK